MHYKCRKIRIWPIAITILLLAGFILSRPGASQNVGARAIIQSIDQDTFAFSHVMIELTPSQDGCLNRVGLQLSEDAVDIDVTVYDDITALDTQRFIGVDRLGQALDQFSIGGSGGSVSAQLPNPVRLSANNPVYVAINTLPEVLNAESIAAEGIQSYISYDGIGWRESRLTFAIELETAACAPDVPAGPAATNTPFIPMPTATFPPTVTPIPTTAPDQPTHTPTASVPAQIVCEAPPIHLRAASTSFDIEAEEENFVIPSSVDPFALDRFPTGQFSNPSLTEKSLRDFYLNYYPDLLQPFDSFQRSQTATSLTSTQPDQPSQIDPTVTGSLLLPDGMPASSFPFAVYEVDSSGNISGDPVVASETDEAGAFGIYLLPGTYLLRASPPVRDADGLPVDGIQALEHSFEVVDVDNTELGQFTLVVPTKVIQGQIVHADGTRISEARVDALNITTGQYVFTYPDNNGNFALSVGGGSWQVSILPALGVDWIAINLRQDVQFELDELAETVDDLVFTVRATDAVIRGQITDPSGQPLTSDSLEVFGLNFNTRFDLFDTVTESFAYGFVDASGQFTIPVASGIYEGNVWIDSEFYPQFMGNFLEDLVQVTTGVVDVGQIRALANTSTLQGTVSNSDGGPVPNVMINLWRESGLFRTAMTDENGLYEMTVPSGDWWIRPEPQAYQSQLFIGDSQQVSVDATAPTQLDFSLEPSAGVLDGTVVDTQGSLLNDVNGYAYIRRDGTNRPAISVEVENGRFSTKIPYGDLRAGMFLGPESLYVLPTEATPEESSGSSDFSIQLEVLTANAQVEGQLRELDGTPVTGVSGDVVAVEQGRPENWKRSTINSADGTYSLSLIPGTWDLVYELNLSEGDNTILPNLESPVAVIAEADTTVTENLPVTTLVQVARGAVVDENGRPVSNALVMIRSDNFEGNVRSDASGLFSAYIPSSVDAGVEAASTDASRRSASGGSAPRGSSSSRRPRQFTQLPEIPSQISVVEVDDALGEVGDMQVVLRFANAYLTGQVLDLDEQPVGGAKVSGVNTADAQAFTAVTESNGCFTAPIKLEGEYEWEITTRYQNGEGVMMESQFMMTGDETEATNQLQAASAQPQAIANLPVDSGIAMAYRGIIPQQEVHTFSIESGWGYTMPDGFTIQIPPNAINSADLEARIQIIPEFMLNDTYFHRVVGYGYRISVNDSNGRAILSNFRSNIQLTLPYQDEGIADVEELIVAYRTNDQWLKERRFIQNQADSTFSVSINKPGVYAVAQLNPIPALDEGTPIFSSAPASLAGSVASNNDMIADGDEAIWTVRVTNDGEQAAESAVLIAQLPSGTQIAESSLAEGWVEQEGTQRYQLALEPLAGGESISKSFAVTLLENSGLVTILEPRILLQSDASGNSINLSTGLGNNIEVDRVPTSSPEEEEEEVLAVEHYIYLPVIGR